MRIQLTIRNPSAAVPDHDVVVDCPRPTRSVELRRALGASSLSVGDRHVPDSSVVGSPPLLDGAVVQIGAPADPQPLHSPWELWVLTGPDAGLRVPLLIGRSIVGRSDDALVRLTDLGVSRHHARVDVTPWSAPSVTDLQGRNGTRVCGERLDRSAHPLEVGDVIDVGRTRLQLHRTPRDVVPARPDGEGHLVVHPRRRAPAGRTGGGAVPGPSTSGRADALSVGGAGCSNADGRRPRCGHAVADHAAVRADRSGALASRAGWASGDDGARLRPARPRTLPPSTTRGGRSRTPCPGNGLRCNGRIRRWREFWRRSRHEPARCGATGGGPSASGSVRHPRRCGSSATLRPRHLGSTRYR